MRWALPLMFVIILITRFITDWYYFNFRNPFYPHTFLEHFNEILTLGRFSGRLITIFMIAVLPLLQMVELLNVVRRNKNLSDKAVLMLILSGFAVLFVSVLFVISMFNQYVFERYYIESDFAGDLVLMVIILVYLPWMVGQVVNAVLLAILRFQTVFIGANISGVRWKLYLLNISSYIAIGCIQILGILIYHYELLQVAMKAQYSLIRLL